MRQPYVLGKKFSKYMGKKIKKIYRQMMSHTCITYLNQCWSRESWTGNKQGSQTKVNFTKPMVKGKRTKLPWKWSGKVCFLLSLKLSPTLNFSLTPPIWASSQSSHVLHFTAHSKTQTLQRLHTCSKVNTGYFPSISVFSGRFSQVQRNETDGIYPH